MVKREGRLLCVTYAPVQGDDERVLWMDIAYDQVVQLPLAWPVWRYDTMRARQGEDVEIPSWLQERAEKGHPWALFVYVLHQNVVYRGCITARDAVKDIVDGRATLDFYAEAAEHSGDETGSGMSSSGLLVNITPAEVAPRSMSQPSLRSHPVRAVSISDDMAHPQRDVESITTAVAHKLSNLFTGSHAGRHGSSAALAQQGGPEDGSDGGDADTASSHPGAAEGSSKAASEENAANNPLVQLVLGGIMRPQSPALHLTAEIALYPVAPMTIRAVVKWQQEHGILPRNNFWTAWQLSAFSGGTRTRAIAVPASLMVLLSLWLLLYVHIPAARVLGDGAVDAVHAALPASLQQHAATLWHALLPAWLLAKVAPNVAGMVLLTALPLLSALVATSAMFGVFCLRTLSSPVRGNGHVYGVAITGCAAMSAHAWKQRQLEVAERPDVKNEIADGDWITDDVQERYWHGSCGDAAKLRNGLKSSSAWRKKMGVHNIFSCEHPYFRAIKAAFPHGVLAMSTCGHAVFVMKIGVLKERYGDIEAAGVSNDDIVKHLALVYEYIFTKVDPRDLPGGRIINVIDMDGMNVMDVQGKAFKMGNMSSKISQYHFPDRLHRALLINCPGMINQMWSVVKGMLDKNARDRTQLFTKADTAKGLKQILADKDIPKEWGGTRESLFYNSKEEEGLFKLVAESNGCPLQALAIDGMFDPSALHSNGKPNGRAAD